MRCFYFIVICGVSMGRPCFGVGMMIHRMAVWSMIVDW